MQSYMHARSQGYASFGHISFHKRNCLDRPQTIASALGPTPTSLCSSTLARLPLVKTKTLHYSLTAPCVLRSDALAAFVLEPPTPVQLTAHHHARCAFPRLFHCDSSLLRLCLSLLLLAFFTLAHVSKLGS